MSRVEKINKRVDVDFLHGLVILDQSIKDSRFKFAGVVITFVTVFAFIFTVIPGLFTW